MTINGPVSSGDLFFFYGLLKKGAAGMPAHIDLEAGGAFMAMAYTAGHLYNLGHYPGLVEGDGLVRGILYRLDDVSLEPLLDEFEDVDPENPRRSLYHRVRRDILDASGRSLGIEAWVYRFNRPAHVYKRIIDGNWPLDAGRGD